MKDNMKQWLKNHFDDRQQKEIEFARLYASAFNHGTDGHNAKLIIAKMADLLDSLELALTDDNFDEELAPAARKVLGIND